MRKIVCFLLMVFLLSGCTKEPDQSAYYLQQTNSQPIAQTERTPIGWGIKKEKGKEPEIDEKTKQMFQRHHAYYIDPAREKKIYLTFDEGYENGYTGKILDVLKEQNVPAAFFITGPYLETETELVKRMVAEGHIVGNHTVHHPNLAKLESDAQIKTELEELSQKFFEQCGAKMQFMRPPEGVYSERVLSVADEMGYQTVFWSFAYKDWDPKKQQGADYAFSQITPYLHDGAILLLHAVSSDNADALERLILFAKEQGYTFGSLTELRYPKT